MNKNVMLLLKLLLISVGVTGLVLSALLYIDTMYDMDLVVVMMYTISLVGILQLYLVLRWSKQQNTWLRWLLIVLVIKLVIGIVNEVVIVGLLAEMDHMFLGIFYAVIMDIVLLFIVIRYFNIQEQPFWGRAPLLLWGISSLNSFNLLSDFAGIGTIVGYVLFFVSMCVILIHNQSLPE